MQSLTEFEKYRERYNCLLRYQEDKDKVDTRAFSPQHDGFHCPDCPNQ